MRRFDRRSVLISSGCAAAVAAVAALPKPALTQAAFPSRPVRLIVPAPAGSRHGVSGRLFAESLAKEIGQPVEVVNPDNSIGYSYAMIAEASRDGHTLGYATVDITILHQRGLSGVKPKDVTPLALLNEDPAGIHVRADSPWQTAKQLTEHIKANPGKLKASSSAAGAFWHLSTASWLAAIGLNSEALPWVAATGPAAAVEDMMLGGSDVIVCSTAEVRATPQSKSLRTLAVMARNRIPRFGNVPTLQQAAGSAHTAGAWRGLVGPKGLDAGAAAAVTAAARKAWDNKEFQTAMTRRGFVPTWLGSREFGQYMDAYDTKMAAALKSAGVAKS